MKDCILCACGLVVLAVRFVCTAGHGATSRACTNSVECPSGSGSTTWFKYRATCTVVYHIELINAIMISRHEGIGTLKRLGPITVEGIEPPKLLKYTGLT